MSKHWKPAKQTVELRPSRIRRDPVRVEITPQRPRTAARSREQEIWLSAAGILLFAFIVAAVIIGISAATIFHDDPAADARANAFDQCYNGGPNCVVDGGTIYVAGEKVLVAGVAAPAINGAACPDERSRGINAAVELANLLNSGSVTLGPLFRDAYGRKVRNVEVKGEGIGQRMINDGLVRAYDGTQQKWCP